MIEDKRGLSERTDGLTLELSNAERKFQETLKNQEQRHSAEIRRLKSLQDTSNKLKQEKWVDEKTKRIKEQTVRGLEPEIQRLLARHNAEIADLEAERERRRTLIDVKSRRQEDILSTKDEEEMGEERAGTASPGLISTWPTRH